MLGHGVNSDVPSEAKTSSFDDPLGWRDNKVTMSTFAGTGSVQITATHPQSIPASQTGQYASDQHIQWSPATRDQYGAIYQSPTQLQPLLLCQPVGAQASYYQPSSNQQYPPYRFDQDASRRRPMPTSATWTCHPFPSAYGHLQTPSYPAQRPGTELQQRQVYQQPQNACSAKRSLQPPLHDPTAQPCRSNAAASGVYLHQENCSHPPASVLSSQGKATLSSDNILLDVSLVAGASNLPAQSAMQPSIPNAPNWPQLRTLSQKHPLSNEEAQAAQNAGQAQTELPGTVSQTTRTQDSAFFTENLPNPQPGRPQALPISQLSQPPAQAITTATPHPHGQFPDQHLLSTQQNLRLPKPLSASPSDSKDFSTDAERDRDTLGVDECATQDEIRAAYWKREFEYHPARHRDATPEIQALIAVKLTKAQAAVDRLKGFDGLNWGAWEGLEEYSNAFCVDAVDKSG